MLKQIAVFAVLIGFSISAWAEASDLLPYLTRAFGADALSIEKRIKNKEYLDKNGERPADKLNSGDVLIYVDADAVRDPAKPRDAQDLPPVFHDSLQGFIHASLVAHDDPSSPPYHLDSPPNPYCDGEFQGDRAYIVLHPKKTVTKNAKFEQNIDDLAFQLRSIGYKYDTSFDTEILGMSPSARASLHASIMSYDPNERAPKPPLPAFYCSELVVTAYALLGIMPTIQITGGELLDQGAAPSLKTGESKEQLARETADGLVNAFSTSYRLTSDTYRYQIDNAAKYKLTKTQVAQIKEALAVSDGILKDLETKRALVNDYIRARFGLCSQSKPNESAVQSLLKSVAFYFANEKPIVRPVDLLRDALSKNGNFEISGYYSGKMKKQGCGE